jgi:hypothetical protein
VWDWQAVAASLPPPRPQKNSYHEQKANQRFTVLPVGKKEAAQALLEQARFQDEQDLQAAIQSFAQQMGEWEKLKNMARRILTGEHKAYTEALVEFSPFAEISDLGSSINFTVHNAKLNSGSNYRASFMDPAIQLRGSARALTEHPSAALLFHLAGAHHPVYNRPGSSTSSWHQCRRSYVTCRMWSALWVRRGS